MLFSRSFDVFIWNFEDLDEIRLISYSQNSIVKELRLTKAEIYTNFNMPGRFEWILNEQGLLKS